MKLVKAEDALPSYESTRRAKVIYDLIQIAQNYN
jgi:hypothetical protein